MGQAEKQPPEGWAGGLVIFEALILLEIAGEREKQRLAIVWHKRGRDRTFQAQGQLLEEKMRRELVYD